MNYYIITGASRGLGEALTRNLLMPGNTLLAISRTLNEDLTELAASIQVPLFYFECDLGQPKEAENCINAVFDKIHLADNDRIALVNNAGMLEPVAPLQSVDFAMAEKHIKLNLLAPMILSSIFIARTLTFAIPKVILNISSGASFIPYSGWSVYGSSKAGIDMMTKVVGLEQSTEPNPVTIFALAPGIIETGMQESIRQLDKTMFPGRDSFISLYEEGRLSKPGDVAQIILGAIFSAGIQTGSVMTIEQLEEYI
ncbi:MAG: SDR family NAD(P)-dependent oxidoreductase [Bacteroidota bacterium]